MTGVRTRSQSNTLATTPHELSLYPCSALCTKCRAILQYLKLHNRTIKKMKTHDLKFHFDDPQVLYLKFYYYYPILESSVQWLSPGCKLDYRKCKYLRLRIELGSPCPFPATIPITPFADSHIYSYIFIMLKR